MTEHLHDDAAVESIAPPVSRMVVATMALLGLLIATYTLMFKLGLIGTLECGTGGCERVQTSPWATQLGVPVPVWGVVGYGAMLVVAMLSLQAFAEAKWISLMLLAGGIIAFGFSLYLSYLEATVINAWCRWCIGSAVVATIMFLAVLPEVGRLRGGSAAPSQADHPPKGRRP